jgi:hypothetical protein
LDDPVVRLESRREHSPVRVGPLRRGDHQQAFDPGAVRTWRAAACGCAQVVLRRWQIWECTTMSMQGYENRVVSLAMGLGSAALIVGLAAAAEPTKDELIEDALSAAPPAVRATAGVMDEQGNMLREGDSAYVCMPTAAAIREFGSEPMCLDEVWMRWADAWLNKKPFTTDRVGIGYMLAGDAAGASNIDPFATEPTADNDWVVEGPHVMVIVPDPAQLAGLPDTPTEDGAYVMWKGTPYAHLMVPVGPRPAQRTPSQ